MNIQIFHTAMKVFLANSGSFSGAAYDSAQKYLRVKESETTFQCAEKFKYKIKTTRGLQKNEAKKLHPLDKNGSNFVTVDGINKKNY